MTDGELASRLYGFLGDRTSTPARNAWRHEHLQRLVRDLMPIVREYADERVTERLVQAAMHFDGYTESTEIALGGQRYVVTKLHEFAADPSQLDPCDCPDLHCDECGCCA